MDRFLVLTALLLVGSWRGLAADYAHPTWRIPPLTASPTIDGTIGEDEYANVPAITGMVTWGGPTGADKSVVARVQQVTWYVGYDAEYLYIAMRSPHPAGTWPRARAKERDSGDILWDDHTEIQIATKGRRNYSAPGKGFYKIMTNAKGNWRDEWYFNGTPGTEQDWTIGGDYRCSVTEDRWDMEMSISLRALGEKQLDGKSYVLQLLRADAPGGVYFAGWVGEAWMKWNQFGEVVFDPAAPVCRLVETGELAKGQANVVFELVGTQPEPQPVTVTVSATGPDGVTLWQQTQPATVAAGQRDRLAFEQQLIWPAGTSSVHLLATTRRTDAETGDVSEVVLYEAKLPIKPLTDEVEWQARVEPWLTQKPKTGDPEWRFAYWPSHGVAESTLDLDYFGMPEAIVQATRFAVSVQLAGGEPLASGVGKIENRAGRQVLSLGTLPEGEYVATLRLLSADGQTVHTQEQRFVRRIYPWEGNTLGKDLVVLPPYKPITVEQGATIVLKPWLRDYVLGDLGLPARIEAEGGAGKEDILAAPIRLELTHDGEVAELLEPQVSVFDASDSAVTARGTTQAAGIVVTVNGRLEFDGWYEVELVLTPPAGGTSLDQLSLVLPMTGAADTMYVQRGADTIAGENAMGNIPAGDGVVWSSAELLPARHNAAVWGSFAPIIYAGNGDKGLWWFADDNRDWVMSEALPAIQYVRRASGVEVRINLIASPVQLDDVRRFRFALLADPVKLARDERRIGWGWEGPCAPGWYAHSTFGWRQWGRSSDGYHMEAEDRLALQQLLQGLREPGRPLSRFREDAITATQRLLPITLYGSTKNMMVDLPSFDTFSGEWLGRSFIPSDEPAAKSNGWNMQGSYEATRQRDQREVGINWVQSQVDCFLWYHEKLLRECPVNGTWWDNASSFQIKDYDPERQTFYWRWNVFMRRDLCRRLNTIGWQLNRRPWWINNLHVDWMFNQVSWHIENDYYIDGPTNTLLDQMTVGQFRAATRLKRGIVHRLASRYGGQEPSTQAEQRLRSRNLVGLCLLHDIGAYLWSQEYAWEYRRLPELLHERVGFFDENSACVFTGYWRSDDLVRIETPGVWCSVYRGKGRAVLVVLNENPEPVDVVFEVLPKLLGRAPTALTDAETGQAFRTFGNRETRQQEWGEYGGRRFALAGHDVRLIVVE